MHKHWKSHIALALGAAALAGYVDAIGFLSLGGFFVSFMSGNTTRFAAGIAGMPEEAWVAGRLIASFLLGVIVGSLIGRLFTWLRQPMILVLVAMLIAVAAAAGAVGAGELATLLVAGAMGAENTTFERDGEVSIGLTYMAGTLVKLGQRIARALTGGPLLEWTPYALLWIGLAGGAISGAIIWPVVGLGGLWFGSGAALLLALAAFFMARHEHAEKTAT